MGYTRSASADVVIGRVRGIRRVLWAVLVLNVAVALSKLLYGLAIDSTAMQADGFHSLFDATSNVVGLVGISLAIRPADRDHPYGHTKFETYASAVVAAMLALAAFRVASTALEQLAEGGVPPQVDAASFAVMLVTLGVNILVTTWEKRVGTRLDSEILLADAGHTRSDVFVSLGVIASLALVWAGFPKADGVVALLVAGAIVHTAWGIIRQVSVTLSDAARIPPEEIRPVVMGVAGVLGCHHIRTRGSAASVYVDLHVQVDETRSVADGHSVAERVERAICAAFPHVVDVIAHLEPYDEYQADKSAQESDQTHA